MSTALARRKPKARNDIWTPPAVIPHHHKGSCKCEPTVVYIRISMVGDRDPDALRSPDTQLQACVAAARTKNLRIVAVLTDINATGRDFRRERVQQALAMIRNGEAKSVLLWKWSRWARNVEKSMMHLGQVRKAGGQVYSATEDFDQETPYGKFSLGQVMLMDELQSNMIGAGWQSAHEARREEGLPHTGRDRFGYKYIPLAKIKAGKPHEGWADCERCQKNLAHFIPDPVEGPVLAECYRDWLDGVSFRKLAERLNEAGIPTPLGGRWTIQALSQCMDNGFAAGLIRERTGKLLEQNRRMRQDDGKAMRNNLKSFNSWRVGAHDALIDMEVWKAYKAKRLENLSRPPAARREGTHAVSRLLVCDICGKRLITRYSGRLKKHRWACDLGATAHKGIPVSVGNISIEAVVKDWVRQYADPAKEDLDARAKAKYRATKTAVTRDRTAIEADLRQQEKMLRNYEKMCAAEDISLDRFRTYKREIDAEIAKLQDELAKLKNSAMADGRPPYTAFAGLLGEWDEMAPADLNKALSKVIGMIIVRPAEGDRSRLIKVGTRIEIVAKWDMAQKEEWLDARRMRAL